jgi:hypothetical protein
MIAAQVDTCCPAAPVPVEATELSRDPCLLPYPPPSVLPDICKERLAEKGCAHIACDMPVYKASRLVEPKPGGGCQWKSECATDTDCGVLYNGRSCCDCGQVLPKKMLEVEPCLFDHMPDKNDQKYKECIGSRCQDIKQSCSCIALQPLIKCTTYSDGINLCSQSK